MALCCTKNTHSYLLVHTALELWLILYRKYATTTSDKLAAGGPWNTTLLSSCSSYSYFALYGRVGVHRSLLVLKTRPIRGVARDG